MATQSETLEVLELTIIPIPPDTVTTVKAELLPYIEETLEEQGQESLLAEGQIQIEIERTFPTDQVVTVAVTLLSSIALETFKEVVLPRLKKRFETKQKRRRKGKARKK